MSTEGMRGRRVRLNGVMQEADAFFREFGALDGRVYEDGAIGRRHKELMGLAISVATRCDECVLYHMDGCLGEGASRGEILEAIKIGVIAGGSITYRSARFAFEVLEDGQPSATVPDPPDGVKG